MKIEVHWTFTVSVKTVNFEAPKHRSGFGGKNGEQRKEDKREIGMKEICQNCRWWENVAQIPFGHCRRHAPIFDSAERIKGDKSRYRFPVTPEDCGCGEFEPKMAKLKSEDKENTRVYILARELDVESSTIIKKCQKHNFEIKNHMSPVSSGLAGLIREWFSNAK